MFFEKFCFLFGGKKKFNSYDRRLFFKTKQNKKQKQTNKEQQYIKWPLNVREIFFSLPRNKTIDTNFLFLRQNNFRFKKFDCSGNLFFRSNNLFNFKY